MVVSPDKIYFLRYDNGPWENVSKQDWVRAERAAGFVNTLGRPDEPGTASFGSTVGDRHVDGRTVNVRYFKPGDYDWDPPYRDAVAPVVEAAKVWFDPRWEQEANAAGLEEAHELLGLEEPDA